MMWSFGGRGTDLVGSPPDGFGSEKLAANRHAEKVSLAQVDSMNFMQDTPMQVPLNFYKTWAPEMRAHAKSLGKDRFGIWGEFYVTPARYATMTGRGRDSTMLLGCHFGLFPNVKHPQIG